LADLNRDSESIEPSTLSGEDLGILVDDDSNNLWPLLGWMAVPRTIPQHPRRLFEFKPERLKDFDQDGWFEYYPMNSPDARSCTSMADLSASIRRDYGYPRQNLVAPCATSTRAIWQGSAVYRGRPDECGQCTAVGGRRNSRSSAGLIVISATILQCRQCVVGLAKIFPTGDNYTPRVEEDNLTNFSEGRTLGVTS
jgi:hypothetical protein